MAVHGEDLNPGGSGLPEGIAEGWIRDIIGMEILHICHLDHKKHIGPIALLQGGFQAVEVLGSPLRGGIGEGTDAV